jgi:hypothetical protein
MLAVNSNISTLRRHNIPGDGLLHSHRRESLKSYILKPSCHAPYPCIHTLPDFIIILLTG